MTHTKLTMKKQKNLIINKTGSYMGGRVIKKKVKKNLKSDLDYLAFLAELKIKICI